MSVKQLSPDEIGFQITDLVQQGKLGEALDAARAGWRDYPDAKIGASGASFEQLTRSIVAALKRTNPGLVIVAAPAESEESQTPTPTPTPEPAPVVPVSAAPVPVAAPVEVSVPPVQVSAPPAQVQVSVSAAAAVLTIERTPEDGTIIRTQDETVKAVLSSLGWRWAKRFWMYLGDRSTVPNMGAIVQAVTALESAGFTVVNTVRGDEAARPVSAPPARPVSAKPAAGRRRTTRENAARGGPVSTRPVSAPAVQAQAVAPAVQPMDGLGVLMKQLADLQAAVAAVAAGQPVPVASPFVVPAVPAVAVPTSAVPVEASVSAVPDPDPGVDLDAMIAGLLDERLAKVREQSWMFKVAAGASARKTADELRSVLDLQVGSWWIAQRRGTITFKVYVNNRAADVIHVSVKEVSGEVTTGTLNSQVVGVGLTVHGIGGRANKSDLDGQ